MILIKNTLETTNVLNTKIGEAGSKIPDISGLVISTVFNANVSEVENKILDT